MKAKHLLIGWSILLLLLGLFYCGGSRTEDGKEILDTSGSRPNWINNSGLQGDKYVAVGLISDSPSLQNAEELAEGKVRMSFAQMISTTIEASSEQNVVYEERTGDYANRTTEAKTSIMQSTSAQIAGVTIEDFYWEKYRTQSGGEFYDYWAYGTVDKQTIDELIEVARQKYLEELYAVNKKIEQAEEALGQGKVGAALQYYVDAVSNAARRTDQQHRIPELMNEISSIMSRVSFRKENDNQQGSLRNGLPEPLIVTVLYNNRPAIETPVKFYMPHQAGSTYDEAAVTDSSGKAYCQVTRINNAASRENVVVTLNAEEIVESLLEMNLEENRARGQALVNQMYDVKTEFTYSATSAVRSQLMVVIIIEKDYNNNIVTNSSVSNQLLSELAQGGFNATLAPSSINVSGLANLSDQQIIDRVKPQLPSGAKFLMIFKTSCVMRGDSLSRVEGAVNVWDLEANRLYGGVDGSERGRATNIERSYSSSINDLAEELAEEIVDDIF